MSVDSRFAESVTWIVLEVEVVIVPVARNHTRNVLYAGQRW